VKANKKKVIHVLYVMCDREGIGKLPYVKQSWTYWTSCHQQNYIQICDKCHSGETQMIVHKLCYCLLYG